MNFKIRYWNVLMLLLLHFLAKSQDTGLNFYTLNEASNRLTGKLQGEVYYIDLIANSNFFLQKDWVNCTVVLKDGNEFKNIKTRYLVFSDELVVYNENNRQLFKLDKKIVKQFSYTDLSRPVGLTERTFVNLDTSESGHEKTFMEQIYSGEVKLLAFHSILQKKVKPFTDAAGRLADTVYEPEIKYYIYSQKKGLTKIKLKNQWLIKVYNENKKEIKKQLRKSKIKVKDELTAIEAFEELENAGLIK